VGGSADAEKSVTNITAKMAKDFTAWFRQWLNNLFSHQCSHEQYQQFVQSDTSGISQAEGTNRLRYNIKRTARKQRLAGARDEKSGV
jgi:hypothetical protein